jgi:aminoglycoside 6'-N-acetyltransferase
VLLDDIVVAHCDIRHPLTPKLERFGGNIGYHVHPSYRNRGIATFALREALGILAGKGEAFALLTCAHDNVASIRTIEKCGGRRIADSMRRRYVIPTGASTPVAKAGLTIRPVRHDDYSMLCDWFDDDDFVRWWGARTKPAHEVEAKYLGRRPGIRSYIIDQYSVPIGYLQDWQPDPDTIGIDIILLVPMQNKGIGTVALHEHAERLVAEGWRQIGIDPSPHNARAIRSFEKAGFRVVEQPREPDHLWMTYVGDEPIRRSVTPAQP